ncbi:MAG: ricin-type beta-trefoil lectin domain protein [Candidatus Saccharimonadales bacterium]
MNIREVRSNRITNSRTDTQPVKRVSFGLVLVGLVFIASLVSWIFLGTSHASALGAPIKSGWSGYCLDDYKSKLISGNQVDLWSCNDTSAQDWTVSLTQIMHGGNLCLTAESSTKLTINTCNQSANQVWLRDDTSFINPQLHKCLTAEKSGDDQPLNLTSCSDLTTAAKSWQPNIDFLSYPCSGSQGQVVACNAIKEWIRWTTEPSNHEALLNAYTGGTPYEEWCADFVSYVFKQAGYPFTNGNYAGWDENNANNIVNQGFNVQPSGYIPKPGDIGYFNYFGGHVEIVIVGGKTPTFIYGNSATIDPTTGNGQMETNTITDDGALGQLQYYMSPTPST